MLDKQLVVDNIDGQMMGCFCAFLVKSCFLNKKVEILFEI